MNNLFKPRLVLIFWTTGYFKSHFCFTKINLAKNFGLLRTRCCGDTAFKFIRERSRDFSFTCWACTPRKNNRITPSHTSCFTYYNTWIRAGIHHLYLAKQLNVYFSQNHIFNTGKGYRYNIYKQWWYRHFYCSSSGSRNSLARKCRVFLYFTWQ